MCTARRTVSTVRLTEDTAAHVHHASTETASIAEHLCASLPSAWCDAPATAAVATESNCETQYHVWADIVTRCRSYNLVAEIFQSAFGREDLVSS